MLDQPKCEALFRTDKTFNPEEQEPLLRENPDRFVLLPLEYTDMWEMYKKHIVLDSRRNRFVFRFD